MFSYNIPLVKRSREIENIIAYSMDNISAELPDVNMLLFFTPGSPEAQRFCGSCAWSPWSPPIPSPFDQVCSQPSPLPFRLWFWLPSCGTPSPANSGVVYQFQQVYESGRDPHTMEVGMLDPKTETTDNDGVEDSADSSESEIEEERTSGYLWCNENFCWTWRVQDQEQRHSKQGRAVTSRRISLILTLSKTLLKMPPLNMPPRMTRRWARKSSQWRSNMSTIKPKFAPGGPLHLSTGQTVLWLSADCWGPPPSLGGPCRGTSYRRDSLN